MFRRRCQKMIFGPDVSRLTGARGKRWCRSLVLVPSDRVTSHRFRSIFFPVQKPKENNKSFQIEEKKVAFFFPAAVREYIIQVPRSSPHTP